MLVSHLSLYLYKVPIMCLIMLCTTNMYEMYLDDEDDDDNDDDDNNGDGDDEV